MGHQFIFIVESVTVGVGFQRISVIRDRFLFVIEAVTVSVGLGRVGLVLVYFFAIIGNVTEYLLVQNCRISLFVPGSCPPKLFAGNPMTTNPLSLYLRYKSSSAAYSYNFV